MQRSTVHAEVSTRMTRRLRSQASFFFLAAGAAAAAAGAASAVYQAAGQARDRRRFPPPGRLVDVDGRCMHVLSAGSGSPAIVVVSALGSNVAELLGFYRELADETKVVVYDRAGFGWSDRPRRGRREPDEMAAGLRKALAGAGISPPYLLVAHSLGGIIARRFAVLYPQDAAGMVLIDSSHEGQARQREPGDRLESRWALRLVALKRRLRILGLQRFLVSAGYGRLREDLAEDMPGDMADAGLAMLLTSRHRDGVVAEKLLIARSDGQPPSLGDLPLTVITASGTDASWQAMQAELAASSTRGTHIVADRGGHWLQRDSPLLVASAIREMLATVRSGHPRPR